MKPKRLAPTLFRETFHRNADIKVYAPGRVNIIGEHTDYNDGFVMPCAIDYGTAICGTPRDDSYFRVFAADLNQWDEFSLAQPIPANPTQKWTGYVRGVVKFIQQRCPEFQQGADLVICGDVPLSSGLSSSASLEVAVGKFCQVLGQLPLSHTDLALIGQQAENQFVGANCGNMDQLISALGQQDHLLMIDCRSLATQPTPMPDDMAVMIINSHVKHDLVTGEYNQRRQQCEDAAKFFGVNALRDVSLTQLQQNFEKLTALDPLIAKRARHVVSENHRVLDAVQALKQGDMATLGALMNASHCSMRDDFEITTPEIDYLVELAQQVVGNNGGARMTGGGFGGCVVVIAPREKVDAVHDIVATHYQQRTGLKESFYVCSASQGVHQW